MVRVVPVLFVSLAAVIACGAPKKKAEVVTIEHEELKPTAPAPAPAPVPFPFYPNPVQEQPPKSPEPEPEPPAQPQQPQPGDCTPVVGGPVVANPPVVVGTPVVGAPCATPCPPVVANPPVVVGTPVVTAPCAPVVANPPVVVAPVVRIPTRGAPQDCYKATAFVCDVENAIFILMNNYRAARGIAPLAGDFQLAVASREWSYQQATTGVAVPPDFPSRIAILNAEFRGEVFNPFLIAANIAKATLLPADPVITAAQLFHIMIADPVSEANILNPSHRAVGIGVFGFDINAFATAIYSK